MVQAQAEKWRSVAGSILLLIFVLFLLGFQRLAFSGGDDVDLASDSGSLTQQLITLFFFSFGTYLTLKRPHGLRMVRFAFAPFLPIILFCIVSFLWSDFPDLTIRRSLRLFLDTASIILICIATTDARKMALVFVLAPFIAVLADLTTMMINPASFTEIGFAGIHINKNAAGAAYFFCIGAFFYAIRTKIFGIFTPACWLGLFLTVYLLWISQCKTVLLCVVPALAVVASLAALRKVPHFWRRKAVLVLFTILVALGAALVTMGDENRAAILGDPTLTGRTAVWNFVLSKYSESPIGGIGYGGLWQTGYDMASELKSHQVNWTMNEAHNGYLDVIAQVGIIGLALAAFAVVRQWLDVIPMGMRWQQDRYERFLASFGSYVLVGALLYNLTESALLRTGHSFWAMPLALATCLKLLKRPRDRAVPQCVAVPQPVGRVAVNRPR